MVWNKNRKFVGGNHALLWVREKGSQADMCGEEMRESEAGTKNRNIR